MKRIGFRFSSFTLQAVTLVLLVLFAIWFKTMEEPGFSASPGLINLSFGFVLLFSYVFAHLLKSLRLPLITGYIIAGIIAGPYVSSLLSKGMLEHFQFIDDLALSFIAMSAGGELHLKTLKHRRSVIILNVLLQIVIISALVFFFMITACPWFEFTKNLNSSQIMAISILLGVIATSRSPATAIAIINETGAKGDFTETVLGVTLIKDVLIIILFSMTLSFTKIIVSSGYGMDYHLIGILLLEIIVSMAVGIVSGKLLASYISRVGRDIAVFIVLFGFGITKVSLWLPVFMESHFHISFQFEPLLICISAGFTIQNFSPSGARFMRNIERVSLPIFLLFFSLAGASLNLAALALCWPLAVSFVLVRMAGVFIATYIAGTLNGDPPILNRNAWMAFITQAGVAIGLAQIATRQFPVIGEHLNTIAMAIILINLIIGPVLFKKVLHIVGEAKR